MNHKNGQGLSSLDGFQLGDDVFTAASDDPAAPVTINTKDYISPRPETTSSLAEVLNHSDQIPDSVVDEPMHLPEQYLGNY